MTGAGLDPLTLINTLVPALRSDAMEAPLSPTMPGNSAIPATPPASDRAEVVTRLAAIEERLARIEMLILASVNHQAAKRGKHRKG